VGAALQCIGFVGALWSTLLQYSGFAVQRLCGTPLPYSGFVGTSSNIVYEQFDDINGQ